MSRFALIFLVVLTGCSGASQGPPTRADDACQIKCERPSWFKSMAATERRWGAPVPVQLATLYQESSFRPKAKTPRKYFLGFIPAGRQSSAYGYAQALDGTWDWYREDTGRWRAKRHRFPDASDFMGWYMAKTTQVNGIAPDDAYGQYLAYHEGHTGFGRGSHQSKSWLLSTAARVQDRALMYEVQLQGC